MRHPRFLTSGWRLALTVVAIAAVAAPAATSKPIRQSANEVLAVEFGLGYDVTETYKNGDDSGTCGTSWRKTEWTDEVDAGSGAAPPSTLDTIKGNFTDFIDSRLLDRLPKSVRTKLLKTKFPWGSYNFSAVGPVHGTVLHRLVETGGGTDCSSGTPVKVPFTPPPHDCGTRSLSTPNDRTIAVLGAGRRRFDGTLESLRTGITNPQFAITFTLEPPRPLFRKCDFDALAPEYPFDVSMLLKTAEVTEIANLKVGGRITLDPTHYAGECRETTKTDPSTTCTFALSLHVKIRRVA